MESPRIRFFRGGEGSNHSMANSLARRKGENREMKKGLAILVVCILLLAGCGREQSEAILSGLDAYESETNIDTTDSMIETELYVDQEKIAVYIAEGGRLILDNDGFLYHFAIDMGALGGESDDPLLVFREAYQETRYSGVVTLVPIEYSTGEGDILLGTLHGNHFEPNSEYFDEDYLLDGVAGESICGFIDSISGDTVSVFAGETEWLHQDTYMELVNVNDTPIDIPLAEEVQYVLLDQDYRSVEVTAARFQKMLEQYAQKGKPAGSIFYLDIVDEEVVQIWEHFNP